MTDTKTKILPAGVYEQFESMEALDREIQRAALELFSLKQLREALQLVSNYQQAQEQLKELDEGEQ